VTDRSCAEILAVLLRYGAPWYHARIETVYDENGRAVDTVSGAELEAEARRAVERETGKPAPERE
jgi:hypothetical protein